MDYKGCVQIRMQGIPQTDPLLQLREALTVLPSRLENTSLNNFALNTQQFYDALSLVNETSLKDEIDLDFYREAKRIKEMLGALQNAWSMRIREGTRHTSSGTRYYQCSVLETGVTRFNWTARRPAVEYNGVPSKGLFGRPTGLDNCAPQEYEMVRVINSDIAELLKDPAVIKAEKENREKEAEREKAAAWKRHLAANPELQKWATANPEEAEKARRKWEVENAKKEASQTPPNFHWKF